MKSSVTRPTVLAPHIAAYGVILALLAGGGCATTPASQTSDGQGEVVEASRSYDQWCVREGDWLGDGRVDETARQEFDEHGRLVFAALDEPDDLTLTKAYRYTYDEHGRATKVRVDPETRKPVGFEVAGEDPAGAEKFYDDDGRRIATAFPLSQLARDDDGAPLNDESGRPMREVVRWRIELNYYDESGHDIAQFDVELPATEEMPSPEELHANFRIDGETDRWQVPRLEGLDIERAELSYFNEDGNREVFVTWKAPDSARGVPLPEALRDRFPLDEPHRIEAREHAQKVHAPVDAELAEHLEQLTVTEYDAAGREHDQWDYIGNGMLYARLVTRPGEGAQTDHRWTDHQWVDATARMPETSAADGIFDVQRVRTFVDGELVSRRSYRIRFEPAEPHTRIPADYRSVPFGEANRPSEPIAATRTQISSTDIKRDAHGNAVERREDTTLRITTHSYDDQGRVVLEEIEDVEDKKDNYLSRIDGEPDKYIRHAYDDRGRKIRTQARWHGDRHKQRAETTVYIYEGAQMVREETFYGAKAEGRAASVFEHDYDSEGRRSHTRKVGWGGEVSRLTAYTYDEAGRPLAETISWPETDRDEEHHEYVYDDEGRLVEETRKESTQKAYSYRKTYTYGDDGRLQTSRTYGSKTGGPPARPQKLTRYHYDADGRLSGKADHMIKVYRYSYACLEETALKETASGQESPAKADGSK